MCVYESMDALKLALGCQLYLLLRPSGNGSVNLVIVRFRFALSEGYRFYIFLPLKFSVLIFSHRRVMGSHISHSSIGLEG